MITPLTIGGVICAGALQIAFDLGILTFGRLIAKTPDKLDRHKVRKKPTDTPIRHSKIWVVGLTTIYGVGSVTALLGDKLWVIIGSVIILAALLFSFTVVFHSVGMYNQMVKNANDLGESVVA